MGKLEQFEILLDRDQSIYVAGETVFGTLKIRIKEKLKINAIKLQLCGSARIHWSESKNNGKSRNIIHYHAYDEYINSSITMLASNSHDDLFLESGDYSYSFQLILPETLPTSFEHDHGRIRYNLYGTLDIPWAFDKYINKCITVIRPLNLNIFPLLSKAYNVSASKTLCCFCCKTQPITASLSIVKSGFVPGESIFFNVCIENRSNRKMEDVAVKLIQIVKLYAPLKSRTCVREVSAVSLNKTINECSSEEWNSSCISIPPVCMSSNQNCRILEISYALMLTLDPTGPNMDFTLSIPITIGTIPLADDTNPRPLDFLYEPSVFEIRDFDVELDTKPEGEFCNNENNYILFYPTYKNIVGK